MFTNKSQYCSKSYLNSTIMINPNIFNNKWEKLKMGTYNRLSKARKKTTHTDKKNQNFE